MTKHKLHNSKSVPILYGLAIPENDIDTSSISNDDDEEQANRTRTGSHVSNHQSPYAEVDEESLMPSKSCTTSHLTMSTLPLEECESYDPSEEGNIYEYCHSSAPPTLPTLSPQSHSMNSADAVRESRHVLNSRPSNTSTFASTREAGGGGRSSKQHKRRSERSSQHHSHSHSHNYSIHSHSHISHNNKSRRRKQRRHESLPSITDDDFASKFQLIHTFRLYFFGALFFSTVFFLGLHTLFPGLGGPWGVIVSPIIGKVTGKRVSGSDKNSPRSPFWGRGGGGVKQIPLPPPNNKVSVVLMNHSRPRMIQQSLLMRTLLAHPSVDEVVLLHSNPKAAFKFVHPKVVNIDATKENDEMGLSLRFYYCQLLKNKWVVHVNDDVEFSTRTLSEMLIEFAKNTKRLVGPYGRDLQEDSSFNGYSPRDSHKNTEVILSKLMVMERETCSAFFEYSHLVWEDTVLNSGDGPLWNGEDIFMSLVANLVYGNDQNNYAMDWLDVWNAPDTLKDYDNGKLDISGGVDNYKIWDFQWWLNLLRRNRHYSYRGTIWKATKQRLAEAGR